MPDRIVLGFDTSAAHCAAALLCGQAVLAVRSEAMARGQAERLMPLLERVLAEAGKAWADIDRIGVGVGEGQVKWSLPDAHTDFIIAVAAEEYGLFLVLCIIAVYTSIIVRSLLRLMRERDPFIRLAGTGLACIFAVQAMINLGVAVRLLPAKGMTLPFVSYGGSSLIAGGIAVGMLLAFTRTRPQGEIGDLLRGRK